MNVFKVFVTICDIFIIAVILYTRHPKSANESLGSLFMELILWFNIILIWS